MKILKTLFLLCVVAIAACDSEGVVRPPLTTVQVFNASPYFSALSFNRVQRTETTAAYGDADEHSFDSGEYQFSVASRQFSFANPLVEDEFVDTIGAESSHLYVMTGTGDSVDTFRVSKPVADEPETDSRITMVHAHAALGQVDFYLEPEGTVLSTPLRLGTLQYQQDVQFRFNPGEARFFLTPAGDPDTVLFESGTLTFAAENDPSFVITDPANRSTAELSIYVVDGSASQRIGQIGLPSSVRFLNGITDRMDRDILLDGDTMTPLVDSLPYGALTEDLSVPVGARSYAVTPAGVPGTEEATAVSAATSGNYHIGVAAGDNTDGIDFLVAPEDRQGIVGQAKINIVNAAGLFDQLLVYIAPPDTDINTIIPQYLLPAPGVQIGGAILPGDYDITYVEAGTFTTRGGPYRYTFEDGGVYGFYLTTSADNTMVDVTPMYDSVP